jgi:pilus assembly protein FimV
MPGHSLFGQAGWNAPRFDHPAGAPAAATVVPSDADVAAGRAEPVRVFDAPAADYESALRKESPLLREEPDTAELNLDDHATVFGDRFGAPPADIHRSEAEVMVEDEGSATRIELAKAYLDIGDVDGARSMLEEVLIEGGPSAKAEAGRILRDLP